VILIAAGFTFGLLCIINETYSPVLLQKKANALENEGRYCYRYDQRLGFADSTNTNLNRPTVMAVKKPIYTFWNVYIAIIYGQQ
jgi:hypothetical protein